VPAAWVGGLSAGGEDHFQQNHCAGGPDAERVDLWDGRQPAWDQNGTYSAFLYARRAVELLRDFGGRAAQNRSLHFFMYLPWHDVHAPLQAPPEFAHPAHFADTTASRLTLNAMASALDSGMKNVTTTLEDLNLWSETLLVWSADNGGWLRQFGSSNWCVPWPY
jgi:arylsulfatase B